MATVLVFQISRIATTDGDKTLLETLFASYLDKERERRPPKK
jgi:hypothetical protein